LDEKEKKVMESKMEKAKREVNEVKDSESFNDSESNLQNELKELKEQQILELSSSEKSSDTSAISS
jgi:hypothetical protein